jgi:hypothetical protein
MRLKELEAELEATRKKISEQLSMVGRSIQSIDPTLYDKEEVLEQAIAMWRVEFDHEPSHSAREHWNACKHAEIEDGDIAMPRYSHMLDIVFEIISEEEDGSDITPEQIHAAIAKRLVSLAESNEYEIGGAIGICDTYEIEEQATSNCKKCRVAIKNGGDWGYCTCCYEETRAQEEEEDGTD